MACIGIGIVIGGLYMGGVCSVVTLFGESDDCPTDPDTGGDDGPSSCSGFTGCPDGQVVNGTSTGTTAAECCTPSTPGLCSGWISSGGTCPNNTAINAVLSCGDGGCDATHCCQAVTTPSGGTGGGGGGGGNDDTTRRFDTVAPGQDFIRCSAALAASQDASDPYNGDCPWPKKQLSEQPQPTTEQPDKGWIQSLLAAPGMGSSATAEGKKTILDTCCPDMITTFPLCRGTEIGRYRVGPDSDNTIDGHVYGNNQPCRDITRYGWRWTQYFCEKPHGGDGGVNGSSCTNNIYTRSDVDITGRTDGRGNPLTPGQGHRLRMQCKRGHVYSSDDDAKIGDLGGGNDRICILPS